MSIDLHIHIDTRVAAVLAGLALLAGPTMVTAAPTLTTFVNGTIADADAVNANFLEVATEFPAPHYDSGWVAVSPNSRLDLTHNLGTQDFSHVTVVGSVNSSGDNALWVNGVTSSGTGQYGNAVQVVNDNTVAVGTYANGGMYIGGANGMPTNNQRANFVRVRLWR
jgi:hypothetical protein